MKKEGFYSFLLDNIMPLAFLIINFEKGIKVKKNENN